MKISGGMSHLLISENEKVTVDNESNLMISDGNWKQPHDIWRKLKGFWKQSHDIWQKLKGFFWKQYHDIWRKLKGFWKQSHDIWRKLKGFFWKQYHDIWRKLKGFLATLLTLRLYLKIVLKFFAQKWVKKSRTLVRNACYINIGTRKTVISY